MRTDAGLQEMWQRCGSTGRVEKVFCALLQRHVPISSLRVEARGEQQTLRGTTTRKLQASPSPSRALVLSPAQSKQRRVSEECSAQRLPTSNGRARAHLLRVLTRCCCHELAAVVVAAGASLGGTADAIVAIAFIVTSAACHRACAARTSSSLCSRCRSPRDDRCCL